MTFDEIRQILEMMRDHELAEFELERGDVKLRLRKHAASPVNLSPAPPLASAPPSVVMPRGSLAHEAVPDGPSAEEIDLAVIKSPIVGTFYRAPEPGAKPFVDLGDTVKKGQALCIIEAMKLMNEIDAECDGEVVKVYVENGQAVQYGERLFALRPL